MTANQQLPPDNALIGVMDSGVGGLSVLAHCRAILPDAAFLYVADSQYAPYGPKPEQLIQARCLQIADYLIAQGVCAIVVACNTATAAAIKTMRAKYALPIIGMEPAVKPAVAATQNQKIGILATTGTLQSARFAALLADYGQQVTVKTQACEGLVECIERGELTSPETMALLTRYCAPLIAEGVDTIVLGCTHYPFLKNAIQAVVGECVTLIETGEAVARQLQRQLPLMHDQSLSSAALTVMTNSQDPQAFVVIQALLGNQVPETALSLQRFDW